MAINSIILSCIMGLFLQCPKVTAAEIACSFYSFEPPSKATSVEAKKDSSHKFEESPALTPSDVLSLFYSPIGWARENPVDTLIGFAGIYWAFVLSKPMKTLSLS